ncbi:MAG: TIGR01777 family oxidoreductase [Syntrophomonadaceae bacterium]|nr:TIGR01777 family oxidoreductase [Syntrophomonadaceae bacterium]
MKVLVFGGTGFIGKNLTRELTTNGYRVGVVTRHTDNASNNISNNLRVIKWQYSSPFMVFTEFRDVDVVVNLAGESIAKSRWTNSVKQEILASRIKATKALVAAINDGYIQPKVLINASAVGYYGPCGDEEKTEETGAGQDFLAQVCQEWENEAYKVQNPITRVITARIGLVLGAEGALNKMVLPFKIYLGGSLGSGSQWLSWIHINDLTRLIMFMMEYRELSGPINATAPEPVRMKTFCSVLGKVLNRPSWLPVPELMLKIALGEMAEMLLHGQRVVPKKAINAGFEFRYPNLRLALEDVLKK